MTKGRKVRTAVAAALLPLVFVLVCFPRYCDLCSYRDLGSGGSGESAGLSDGRSCCCGEALPAKDGGGEAEGKAGGSDSVPRGVKGSRVPFCISTTLASLAAGGDGTADPSEILLPRPYRGRPSPAPPPSFLPHQAESRAPPVS